MLECKDVRPLLADYEAGNLPAEQAGQMEDHLLLCPICAAALEDLRREKDRAAVMPAAASALEVADVAESTQVCVSAPRRKLSRWGKAIMILGVLALVLALTVGVLYKPKTVGDTVDPNFGLPPAGNGQIQPRAERSAGL